MKKKLAIIGASELGCLVANHARNCGLDPIGFYDDFLKKSKYDLGLNVIGNLSRIEADFESKAFDFLFIGIGDGQMKIRKEMFNRHKGKIPFANIIHPSAVIDSSSKLGEGILILPNCTVDYMTEIKDNVTLHSGCIVSHHTLIGNHNFCAPGVHFSGLIKTGECNFFGTGSVIKDCISIENDNIIGAGAVVIRDMKSNSVVVGSPAREIRKNQ